MAEVQAELAKAPVGLRCEYAKNPLGIGESLPRFSWKINDDRRGAKQTAYRLTVGTKPGETDVWDSGEVASHQSTQVVFAGTKLKSRGRYFWQVRYRDQAGVASTWSDTAFFEMGILKTSEWRGQWVSVPLPFDKNVSGPSKYLRRNFVSRRPVKGARLYITARGVFVPLLNGKRVGNDIFLPGWSDFRKRIRYQTYDVTDLVVSGRNTLGVMVGDGWHTGKVAWNPRGLYGENTAALAELHIEYADGSYEVIRSDADWKGSTEGPIRTNDFLDGETYDARKEWSSTGTPAAWATADFDDAAWQPVRVEAHDKVPLEAYVGPPIRRQETLTPKEAWRTTDGKWIFDLGQNMVGWAKLKVKGQPGQQITLRFAEMLNPDRTIYTTNLRGAKVTDAYICKGEGVEEWEPTFTFHGFRFVEVAGLLPGQTPDLSTVTGMVINTDTPAAGSWKSSHEKLNQLMHNIVWGQKGNYMEIPTDCPQRDERLGWTGDAQVFIRTASYNADVAAFFTRWLVELDDSRNDEGTYQDVAPMPPGAKMLSGIAAWADAGIICPWTIYRVYGDVRILERHYDAMKGFVAYMLKKWPNLLRHAGEWTYGDWLSIDSWTPRELIGTAFFAHSVSLMAKIAAIVGKERDAAKHQRLFEKIRKAFNKEFVTPGGYLAGDSQTAYVLALRFGLLDEEKAQIAAKKLAHDVSMRKVLTTGFVGVNLLLPTLSQIGRDDLACKLLINEKYPSWLYSVNHGATTIWERWDGWTEEKGFQTPTMNSFNHYAYGSCGEWMYSAVAGIDLDEKVPGFKHLRIEPRIVTALGVGLTRCEADFATAQGQVKSAWSWEGGIATLEVVIPANASATMVLPGIENVTENGQPLADATGISNLRLNQGKTLCELAAGSYRFSLPLSAPEVSPAI